MTLAGAPCVYRGETEGGAYLAEVTHHPVERVTHVILEARTVTGVAETRIGDIRLSGNDAQCDSGPCRDASLFSVANEFHHAYIPFVVLVSLFNFVMITWQTTVDTY